MTHLNYLWWIYPLGCAALGALLAGGTREPEKNANPALPEGPPALDPSPVIPIDLSFGYLSAELKSPVKIPIPIATASGNRVLAVLVDALHRMSEGVDTSWNDKQRRSALRNYELVIGAIEAGDAEQARSIMEKSLTAAARHWERAAPDELKKPVAWIDSDH